MKSVKKPFAVWQSELVTKLEDTPRFSALQEAESFEQLLQTTELYFRLGYELEDGGESEGSQQLYQRAIDVIEVLHLHGFQGQRLDHSQVAHLAFRHAHKLAERGQKRLALISLTRCIEGLDGAITSSASTRLILELSYALSWCASLRLRLGDRKGALKDLGRVAALCRVLCSLGIGVEAELVARGLLTVTYARLSRALRHSGCPNVAAHFARQSRLLEAVQSQVINGPTYDVDQLNPCAGSACNAEMARRQQNAESSADSYQRRLKLSRRAQRQIRRQTLQRAGVLQ